MSGKSETLILVEAIAGIRFRVEGQQFCLYVGQRLTLPTEVAVKLLARAPGKVRTVSHVDWLQLWREVVRVSDGLTITDARLPRVLAVIQELDKAFEQDNFTDFMCGMDALRQVMARE